jgi:hypothetical protein
MKMIGLIVVLVLISSTASARTWWVQKDGSGDFTVIQDAVDVAASGDTIRIGPGEFFDGRWWELDNGAMIYTRVFIRQPELTLIGHSAEETTIGQEEPWDVTQLYYFGIYSHSYNGVQRIQVENLGFRNCEVGVYSWGVETIVDQCLFQACHNSIRTAAHPTSGLRVSDSRFEEMPRNGRFIWNNWLAESRIERCIFQLIEHSTWNRDHVFIMATDEAVIEHCTFIGGSQGILVDQGSNLRVSHCEFQGQTFIGMCLLHGAEVRIDHSTFDDQVQAIRTSEPPNSLYANNCQFSNISEACFYIYGAGTIEVHDSDLTRGEHYAVMAMSRWPPQDPAPFDFTNNYWGTTDPDSIAAMIYDANDHDDTDYTFIFEPFQSDTTPVVRRSLSEVRALFR